MASAAEEPELVSRATHSGIGLLTVALLYGSAVGAIFALVFACLYGRVVAIGPRSLAILIALAAFVAIALVPALKYPPNPPAVGLHETVGIRTATYFGMIALSLIAMVAAVRWGRGLTGRIGGFNATLAASGGYILLVAAAAFALPSINEVPADFPAVVLWSFRLG